MTPEEKIQSLINAANSTTGESSADLTSAVQNLVNGYTGGGNNNKQVAFYGRKVLVNDTDALFFNHNNDYYFAKLGKKSGDLTVNLSGATSWRYVCKVKFNSSTDQGSASRVFFGNTDYIQYAPSAEVRTTNFDSVGCGFNTGTSASWTSWLSISNPQISYGNWYYIVQSWKDGIGRLSIYDDIGNILHRNTTSVSSSWGNKNFQIVIGGDGIDGTFKIGDAEIDVSEMLIEKNGTALWGNSNSKTAIMGFEIIT